MLVLSNRIKLCVDLHPVYIIGRRTVVCPSSNSRHMCSPEMSREELRTRSGGLQWAPKSRVSTHPCWNIDRLKKNINIICRQCWGRTHILQIPLIAWSHGRCQGGVLCCSPHHCWVLCPSMSEIGLVPLCSATSSVANTKTVTFLGSVLSWSSPPLWSCRTGGGLGGCFHPISVRVFRRGTISLAVRNKAVISASAADDTTYLIIWAMVRRSPFQRGMESFSEKKMWAPAWLLDFVSLAKLASECAARIVSLDQ